jgi:hypothetical protein
MMSEGTNRNIKIAKANLEATTGTLTRVIKEKVEHNTSKTFRKEVTKSVREILYETALLIRSGRKSSVVHPLAFKCF